MCAQVRRNTWQATVLCLGMLMCQLFFLCLSVFLCICVIVYVVLIRRKHTSVSKLIILKDWISRFCCFNEGCKRGLDNLWKTEDGDDFTRTLFFENFRRFRGVLLLVRSFDWEICGQFEGVEVGLETVDIDISQESGDCVGEANRARHAGWEVTSITFKTSLKFSWLNSPMSIFGFSGVKYPNSTLSSDKGIDFPIPVEHNSTWGTHELSYVNRAGKDMPGRQDRANTHENSIATSWRHVKTNTDTSNKSTTAPTPP